MQCDHVCSMPCWPRSIAGSRGAERRSQRDAIDYHRAPAMNLSAYPLEQIAARVGTPFYLYDAGLLREALGRLGALRTGGNIAVRYAMKANSARKVLQIVREAGLWIDAVSGNEVLRAARAGFPLGNDPPVIM